MNRLSQIYKGIDELKELLIQCGFFLDKSCLVKIFTSVMDKETSLKTAKEIKKLLPNSQIVGATSSSAVLFNCKQYENETLIIIETFDFLNIKTETFIFENKTCLELVNELYSVYQKSSLNSDSIINILFSEQYTDIQQFVEEVNNLPTTLKLVGGIAGTLINKKQSGFVFTDEEIVENGAITFLTTGENVSNYVKSSNTVETISPIYTITKMNGSIIEEIENISASKWIDEYIDIISDWDGSIKDLSQQYQYNKGTLDFDINYLTHFPLVLEDYDGSVRFTYYNKNKEELSLFHSKLSNFTRVRMGYLNPQKAIKEILDICTEIVETPIEYLFAYTCYLRKSKLKNSAKWEIEPFHNYNVCGIFMGGELGFENGKNIYHHNANVLVGISEKTNYLIPDMLVLDNTEAIDNDTNFLKKIIDKKEKISEYYKNITSKSTNNSFVYHNQYIDTNFNMPNLYKYKEDLLDKKFDKLCLVESTSADATIVFSGYEAYYEAGRDIIKMVYKLIKSLNLEEEIFIYTLNYKTFLIACNKIIPDNEFIDLMSKFYVKFQFVTSKATGISGVTKFAVVLKQEKLLEDGIRALASIRSSEESFFVFDKTTEMNKTTLEEGRMVTIINSAITNNLVVPYYQGIANNKTGKIDKYEALMRIKDKDNVVYSPFMFLDIAKKYKLYNRISQMLITIVLEDFKYKTESVSLNISLYDIRSSSFRYWFINKLEEFPEPERIIVEFTENEDYNNLDVLFEFVKKLKAIGVKIAIDDFGVGYSTFASIVSLKPDFIKIDGSIISKILTSEDSLIILNTIRFLADQLGIENVAEFVENEKIQRVLVNHNVEFSQGYYFSKPEPIGDIEFLEKNKLKKNIKI